jgi:peptidylprolyl isomerase
MAIKKGDKVKIEYTGTFEDGQVFDATEKHGHPLEFEVGSSQVIKGFEEAVTGMEDGQEKDITIQPEDAYGPRREELMKKVPRDQLPKDQEPKAGMMLGMQLPNGQQVPVLITAVDEKEVTLDLNHPLAGRVLKFKLKVVGVTSA